MSAVAEAAEIRLEQLEGTVAVDDASLGEAVGNAELRDPGLYPRLTFFHSNWVTDYLSVVPGQLNALVSAWALTKSGKSTYENTLRDIKDARIAFVDSGAISAMFLVPKGKATADDVRAWCNNQQRVQEIAWAMYEQGVTEGVASAMDLPQYEELLNVVGIPLAEANAITDRNCREWMNADLPPGWKPVFPVQGQTVSGYEDSLKNLGRIGALDLARDGDAWLAVGATRDRQPPALYSIYKRVREVAGDSVHIHALGVARKEELTYMATRHWVNGADSSSSVQEILYNRGPYKVTGPRPYYLTKALFAASAMMMDAEIAASLKWADEQPLMEQEELF